MNSKRLARLTLLAGVATVAAGGMLPLASAQAADFSPYVSLGGGLNIASVPSLSTSAPYYYNLSTPYPYNPPIPTSAKQVRDFGTGGLALISGGLDLHNGWRVELEGSYRHVAGARFNVQAEGSTSVGVDRSTYALMGNLWRDFTLTDTFSAHIGGGLGVEKQSLRVSSSYSGTKTFDLTGAAAQVGVGIDMALTPNLKLGADYRYFQPVHTQQGTVKDATNRTISYEKLFVTTKDNSGDHAFLVSLRWSFGN